MATPNQPREHGEVEALLAEHYVRKFARDTGRPESDFRGKMWVAWDGDAGVYDLRGESIPAHPDLVARYPNGWSLLDHIAPAEAEATLQNTFTGVDSKATEFCPVHGEVATVSEDGTDRCPQCGRATSTTPEEAERFEHQDDEHPALPALRGMLAAYAPMAEATAQASGEASLHSAVRAARAAIAHASLPADYRPLYRPTQALEQPPVNTFTAVENALAVMLLNHRIREYLELYDPKAFEQAEAALAAHNPSFPAKLAEARKFRTQE